MEKVGATSQNLHSKTLTFKNYQFLNSTQANFHSKNLASFLVPSLKHG
jgi:hypothetical protein